MSKIFIAPADKARDLVLERVVDAPRENMWKALTDPKLVQQWFVPKPWKISECRIDLRPGGEFHITMQGPEGQHMPHTGCYLDIVPGERIIWTGALQPGFRPSEPPASDDESCNAVIFTCVLTLESQGKKTKYTARVLHPDPDHTKRHEAMGFSEGWGVCLNQLVELANTL